MENVTITKVNFYQAIMNAARDGGDFAFYNDAGERVAVPSAMVVKFCEKQIASINNAAEKAKARAKSKSDDLTDTLMSLIDEQPKTIQELIDACNDPDVTRGKVVSRMSRLAREGKVEKLELRETDANNNRRRITAYALPMVSAI